MAHASAASHTRTPLRTITRIASQASHKPVLRDAVIKHLLRTFDPSHNTDNPIYTPDGHWSDARFEAWLVSVGVAAWPRLDSGKIQTDGDAFRLMYHVPGIEAACAAGQSWRDRAGQITDRR